MTIWCWWLTWLRDLSQQSSSQEYFSLLSQLCYVSQYCIYGDLLIHIHQQLYISTPLIQSPRRYLKAVLGKTSLNWMIILQDLLQIWHKAQRFSAKSGFIYILHFTYHNTVISLCCFESGTQKQYFTSSIMF